jgi:hypothetical protein
LANADAAARGSVAGWRKMKPSKAKGFISIRR